MQFAQKMRSAPNATPDNLAIQAPLLDIHGPDRSIRLPSRSINPRTGRASPHLNNDASMGRACESRTRMAENEMNAAPRKAWLSEVNGLGAVN
jgi:hypothetical protein